MIRSMTIALLAAAGIALSACGSKTSSPAAGDPGREAPLPDPRPWIVRVATQDGCRDFTAEMTMVSEDENGNRDQVDFRVQRKYSNGFASTFISVLAPREETDKAILAHEYADSSTEAFTYLPGLRKLTKINSERQLGFRGARVTVQELLGMELGQYSAGNVRRVERGGRKLVGVDLSAKPERVLAFPRIEAFFDEAGGTPVAFDLHDLRGELVKSASIEEARTIQNRLTITSVSIEDKLQKLRLRLATRRIEYDKGIPDKIFTEENLKAFISGASRQLDRARQPR